MTAQYPRVMASGHRVWPSGADIIPMRDELRRVALKLRQEHGTTVALSGMAIGPDTWWASAALDVGMELWAYLPFRGQADLWWPADRRRYERLLAQASRVVVAGAGRSVRLYHARNDAMLTDSDLVVAIRDPARQTGGTVSVVQKARQQHKPIITISPDGQTVIEAGPAVGASVRLCHTDAAR